MELNGSVILLSETDGAIVTSCTLAIIPNLTHCGKPYALIENVVTHSDHHGLGFATALLDAASAHAWDHGCYKIMLMTGSKDKSTLSFYEQAGFVQSKTGFQKRRDRV